MLAGALPLILATLLAASAGVDVHTNADCPLAERISERLKPLLPKVSGTAGERDVAIVEVLVARPDGTTDLSIRLQRADTSDIGHRYVSLTGTCDDMAEAVAAILAAWETDPRSEDSPEEEPAALPVTNEPKDQPVVSAKGPQAAGWDLLVGAGAGAAFVGGVAASGTVEILTGKRDTHWQARVAASTQTARTVTLASGQADWQHTGFAVGLLWHTLDPAWRLSLDAGPVVGWAGLSGNGFTPNRRQRVFEYGGTAGLRLGRTWGRWTLWAEGRASFWLQGERVTAREPTSGAVLASRDVPPVDATASLGLSLALFP